MVATEQQVRQTRALSGPASVPRRAHLMGIHLWTWSGKDFGDRDGDELWTFDGRHVGHFHHDNVFAADGHYLGELRHDDRLITKLSSLPTRRPCFTPLPPRPARPHYRGFGSFEPLNGFTDFPAPEALQ